MYDLWDSATQSIYVSVLIDITFTLTTFFLYSAKID